MVSSTLPIPQPPERLPEILDAVRATSPPPRPTVVTHESCALVREFGGVVPAGVIQQLMEQSFDRLDRGAGLHEYVPLLAYRIVRQSLQAEHLRSGADAGGVVPIP